jgi:thioesterase domain-containing protein
MRGDRLNPNKNGYTARDTAGPAMSSAPSESVGNTNALFARASRNSARVIVPISDSSLAEEGSRPAFYCVHSASGVAGTDFSELAQLLDADVRFYGIQAPPKLMSNFEFGRSIESLASHYVDALCRFQPAGPIMLGGYCVGAIIALAMAKELHARGREVGPLVVIDGVPENTGVPMRRWRPRYWLELLKNIPRWVAHADLMRARTLQSLIWSFTNNASAIGRIAIGLRRGERVGGGYDIESVMDVSRYQPAHKSFINRLFAAAFAYDSKGYEQDVVVYEATVTPLLYRPQIGRTWREYVPRSEVVNVVGTHISIMHAPYVQAWAADLRSRIVAYFKTRQAGTGSA